MPKILWIDNDGSIFEKEGSVLIREGFDVICAVTGEGGLEIFEKQEDISMIILEICLLDINGLQILRKIKEKKPKIPVIIYCIVDFRDDFAAWAAEAYIIKGKDSIDELLETTKKLIM